MDHHLNLYYSYSQGKRDQESERILENNVTRALLITLKGSNTFRKILFNEIEKQILEKYKNRRLRFFSKDKDAQSNNFFYDLQGFNKQYLNNKRIESWIMLKLSPISSGICDTTNSRDDVKELYDLMDSKEKNEKEIQERVEKFRTLLRNQENKLPNEETSEIRNCIDYCERKGLPDGWIIDFCNLIGICVENKIFGSCTRSQIDRHKKYIRTNIDKSFKVSDIYEVEFTWEDIENLLNNIELRENTIENFLTNNLKEYL
ncbi:MAG: hypothetical protein WBO44_03285, partial [Saprospiraceae bacterium]